MMLRRRRSRQLHSAAAVAFLNAISNVFSELNALPLVTKPPKDFFLIVTIICDNSIFFPARDQQIVLNKMFHIDCIVPGY